MGKLILVLALLVGGAIYFAMPYLKDVPCPACEGKGDVTRSAGRMSITLPCNWCRRTGRVNTKNAEAIKGELAKLSPTPTN